MKIFYLGPEGTNSDLASKNIFDESNEFIPLPSIEDIFEKVALSYSYYGVIPFENSYQGVINSSLNCLIDYDLKISKEFIFKVEHNFCSKNKKPVTNEVKKIASHPQVFGQCSTWIREHYPEAEKIITTSTAEAAKLAQKNRDIFCIANSYAVDLFDLVNHASDIQDTKNNRTRFLVISKSLDKKGKDNKTSIMINLKDQPGSLMEILKPFSDLNINMTRIETRPSRNNIYLHTFFIDFEGFYEDKKITKLIEVLESLSEELRIIGSYESLN